MGERAMKIRNKPSAALPAVSRGKAFLNLKKRYKCANQYVP